MMYVLVVSWFMSVLLFTLGSLNLAPMSSRFLNEKTLGTRL